MRDADYWDNLDNALVVPFWFQEKGRLFTDKSEIWKMPWASDLLEQIETNGDIEKFITEKNKKITDEFYKDVLSSRYAKLNALSEKVLSLQQNQSAFADFNEKLNGFEKDIEDLIAKYPPERQEHLKKLLSNYTETGKFITENKKYYFNALTQKPQGLLNRIRNSKKIEEANQQLNVFLEKYQENNLKEQLDNLPKENCFDPLKSKFYSIGERDKKKIETASQEYLESNKNLQNTISNQQKDIQTQVQTIENIKTNFQNSNFNIQEDKNIRILAKEIQNDIKNPKTYNVSNYIEGLDNMADNETVMFNLRLKDGNAAKNIFAYNGLSIGDDTNQWLLHKDMSYTSDSFKFEVFSPTMTVKEAKEIMPKLIDDLAQADITQGIVVPIKPKELLKDIIRERLPQDVINNELGKLYLAEAYKERIKSGLSIPEEKQQAILQRLEISSVDELPKSYNSLDELSHQYPKDKYLFSGSIASDDFCQFSQRPGRTGMVYATPHLKYASVYDGASLPNGKSATNDFYVSSSVGKFDGVKDVRVGFINIYEQSPDDKFFKNFGLEDCSRNFPNDRMITKEEALNGYLAGSNILTDGSKYDIKRTDAETFVTPEKNPLKAKIMHISYELDNMHYKDVYIPVPENPDKLTKHILSSRQADMKDTYRNAPDIYARLQKQKEELNKGIIHQVRDPDFLAQKKEKLLSCGQAVAEVSEKAATKTAVHVGVNSAQGIVSGIAKADNVINTAIEQTVEKGSKVLNTTTAGKVYMKAAEKVADTKVVKAIEKTTAKVAGKAAQTAIGKAVTKTVAKTAGSAVGKSVLKKIPILSAAAGCYFAFNRIKKGDWKGACGEVLSGVAGCFPGVGTGVSTAIDVGLAAKDINEVVTKNKQSAQTEQSDEHEKKTVTLRTPTNKKLSKEEVQKLQNLIMEKQGRISTKEKPRAKASFSPSKLSFIQRKIFSQSNSQSN